MDSQAQLKREQAEEPIKINHPEEEANHGKGPAKVLKKVKEKARKIKKALTKHGHSHEHDHGGQQHIPDDHDLDEEDDDYEDQHIHGGAPGKSHIQMKEDELIPPGTSTFPVVSSSHTKQAPSYPVRASGAATLTPHNTPVSLHSAPEEVAKTFVPGDQDKSRDQRRVNFERPRGLEEDTRTFPVLSSSHTKQAPSHPATLGAATLTPHNTPVSLHSSAEEATRTFVPSNQDKSRDQRRVNFETPRGLEEDPAAPGNGFGSRTGMSNHQSKVTDINYKDDIIGGAALGLGRRKETDEEDDHDHVEVGRDIPVKSFGSNHEPNQSSYTEKIASATSVVAEKAVAAKNAVASKLGYTGETEETTPSSGGMYGSMVSETLTPMYEKVKETGANVMAKLPSPLSGGTEAQGGQDKGVSAKEYLSEKLSPGEEDKALQEVVTEKLHLGGDGEKKGIVTQSEEVEKRLGKFTDQRSEEERKHGEEFAENGEGGIAEKLRDAVTSWMSGTTEEVVQKSTESSSQTLGNTVGKMAGQEGGDSGNMPVQKRFRD